MVKIKKSDLRIKIRKFLSPTSRKVILYVVILTLIFLENFGPSLGISLLTEPDIQFLPTEVLHFEDKPRYNLGILFHKTAYPIALYNNNVPELWRVLSYPFIAIWFILNLFLYYCIGCAIDLVFLKIFSSLKRKKAYPRKK